MGKNLRSLQRKRNVDLTDTDRKRSYNRELFTTVAPRYRLATRVLSFGRDSAWKRLLVRSLPDLPAPHILDLACGTGDLCFLLAGRYAGGSVTGIDLNPDMLALARDRSSSLGQRDPSATERIRFEQADMHGLPFPDASFDLVTGGYALRNAPDLGQALREVRRLLRPGGTAAFLDFANSPRPLARAARSRALRFWGRLWGRILHGDPEVYGYIAESLGHFPDRRKLEELLSELGFRDIRSRSLLGGFMAITWFSRA